MRIPPKLEKPAMIFCKLIMKLDLIPAYRRTYRIDLETMKTIERQWSYFPAGRGLWGFNLLHRMGLLWWYLDRCEWQCPQCGEVGTPDPSCEHFDDEIDTDL